MSWLAGEFMTLPAAAFKIAKDFWILLGYFGSEVHQRSSLCRYAYTLPFGSLLLEVLERTESDLNHSHHSQVGCLQGAAPTVPHSVAPM